jgi:hypothetical protein
MRGDLAQAIRLLDQALSSSISSARPTDRIAMALLKAELLHLDCRDEDALSAFGHISEADIQAAPADAALAIGFNRADILLALYDPQSAREFYRLVDQQRIANFRPWDAESILGAEDAAAAEKHFEALPKLWHEFVRTYKQAHWRAQIWTARRIAHEYVRIGAPHEAVYFSMVGQDDQLGRDIGESLLLFRNVDMIRHSLTSLILNGNLQRHFLVASNTISQVMDAVPEDMFSPIFDWILQRCMLNARNPQEFATLKAAWKAMESALGRLESTQAQSLVRVAVGHPIWNASSFEREQMIKVVNGCVRLLSSAALSALAHHAIPLATDLKGDIDYNDAVNLLCHIASRAEASVRQMMSSVLYPEGCMSNEILAQVAPQFGDVTVSTTEIIQVVDRVAQQVRLQVQRLSVDEEPSTAPDSFGSLVATAPDHKIVVQMASGHQVETIAVYRKSLPTESIQLLINAMLDMIVERENFLTNRCILMTALYKFGDVIDDVTVQRILDVLVPIARGNIEEPTIVMTAAQARNPLNSFRLNAGTPQDLRGLAIYALARLERDKPGSSQGQLDNILEDALIDADPEVRIGGLTAARVLPALSSTALTAVLLETRDSDPKVAEMAYAVLATVETLSVGEGEWRLLLHTLGRARHVIQPRVRRAAAHAVANLVRLVGDATTRARLHEIRETFRADICHSVRLAVDIPLSVS